MITLFRSILMLNLVWLDFRVSHRMVQGILFTDSCSSNPCQNGGTCENTNSTYSCTCKFPYIGTECHELNCLENRTVINDTQIRSPNYPDPYPPYKTCLHFLEVTEGKLMRVTFEDLALGNSADCELKDHIVIFDGNDISSPVIGTYCGNKIPNTIVTTGHQLLCKFRSLGTHTDRGYLINVTAIDDDGTPSSTRTEYYAKEDNETKSHGGRILSHKSHPNDSDLGSGIYEINIRRSDTYNHTELKFDTIQLSDDLLTEPTCNTENNTLRRGSPIHDGATSKVNSAEECCQLCNNTQECKAYAYDKTSGVDGRSCWLKNFIPSASDSQSFDSGIVTPCDNRREKIEIYDNGYLMDVVCNGHLGNGFVTNGSMSLKVYVTNAAMPEKGFVGTFTLFYQGDKCPNENDFKCPNTRCIARYLEDKQSEHCGSTSSNVNTSLGLVTWMALLLVVLLR